MVASPDMSREIESNDSPEVMRGGEPARRSSILVVDDDPEVSDVIAAMLREEGYVVSCASSTGKALEQLTSATVDLILIDLMLPKPPSALELAGRAAQAGTAVVMMSGALDALEEVGSHPHPSLAKPFRGLELCGLVERCLRVRAAKSELDSPS
jgi:two-component system response regulator MtrA